MGEPLNNIDTSLGEITPLVDDYRKTILLCAQDLSNEKAVTLAAYATINFKNQIQALLNKSVIEELKDIWNKTQPDIVPDGWVPESLEAKLIQDRLTQLCQITEQEDK